MEDIVADAEICYPDIPERIEEEPGILLRRREVTVGHDAGFVTPCFCFPDPIEQAGIEKERLASLEIDRVHRSQRIGLVEESGNLRWRECPLR